MIKGKLVNKEEIIETKEIIKEENITKHKIFNKFKIKDIVFLAILSAVLILSCAVMPLVAELTKILFGIAQLVTAFQMSLLMAVGVSRVRKVGSVAFILIFMGAIMVLMSPIMFLSNIFCLLVTETIIVLVFRGYKSNVACFFASFIPIPLGLIIPTIYNMIVTPEITNVTLSNPYIVIGMTIAVTLVGAVGSFLGITIAKELDKAGVLKKNEV